MRRRDAIALAGAAAIAGPPRAGAQPTMPVVGYLSLTSPELVTALLAVFRDGLKESGYVEGRTVAIEHRWAAGRVDLLPALASELVARQVAVIVAASGTTAVAARTVTRTIPIVFISSDPVELGLVDSFSRPTGNATGVHILTAELTPKRLELLLELIPDARKVAFLVNPAGRTAASQLDAIQAAALANGHELQAFDAANAGALEPAFDRLAAWRAEALVVQADELFIRQDAQVASLAARHAVPAIYHYREFVATGGLVSYGPSLREAQRLVGVYTGRILAGARPAELPVQQPTRFELVINLKAARALGLTVPATLLDRADEVIE